jgi:hypothetical protein
MMGMLTEARISPISVVGMNLDTFKKTLLTNLTRNYRFPLQSEFVISEYNVNDNMYYLSGNNMSDDFFEGMSAVDPTTAHFYPRNYSSPFLEDSFLNYAESHPVEPGQEAIFDQWLDEVSRQRAAFRAERAQSSITIHTFRAADLSRFTHVFDHYVNWGIIWRFLLNMYATVGRPSNEDLNLYFNRLIDHREIANLIFFGGSTPGYEACHENLMGFINYGQSCFMDSTIMCMFAFKNSPFFENMIMKPVVVGQERVCAMGVREDYQVRKAIQDQLTSDIASIMKGQRFVCGNLRHLIGRVCRINDGVEDLADVTRPQDPRELYLRLCNALGYNPVLYREDLVRASDPQGSNPSTTSQNIATGLLPPVRVADLDLELIAWPYTWDKDYGDLASGDERPWGKNVYTVLRADCIVVNIDRAVYGGQLSEDLRRQRQQGAAPQPGLQMAPTSPRPQSGLSQFLPPPSTAPAFSGLLLPSVSTRPASPPRSPFSSPPKSQTGTPSTSPPQGSVNPLTIGQPTYQSAVQPATSKPAALPLATAPSGSLGALLASFVPNAPLVAPVFSTRPATLPTFSAQPPYFRDEGRVDPRSLEIERVMQVNDRPYTLRAFVYSPSDGHFAALLKCGDAWFNYDDTNTSSVIARNRKPEHEVDRLLATRAVLLFYYPPFPEVSAAQQAEIDRVVAGLPRPGAPGN